MKKIYFIGIKGVAMSGLAVICKDRGLEVSGSDVPEKFITDKILISKGIDYFENFSVDNLNFNPDLVVIGTSWRDDNVEVAEVKKRNWPFITDSQLRGLLSKEKRTVAVTGVHGKTTTTALASFLFAKAGLEPSFLIGTGMVPDLKANASWSTGRHFIVEGDEYVSDYEKNEAKFLDLNSSVSLITSVEWEHVDVYPSLESIEAAFKKLAEKTKDLIIACGDWPSVKKIVSDYDQKTVTYGFDENNFYQAYDIKHEYDQTIFKVKKQGEFFGEFSISLFGKHNVLNVLAIIILGINEGITLGQIKDILPKFKGAERRFDVSERDNITFVDDYGHHPSEIKTTLEAVRHRYPNKIIWCVFQPHMVSRTKALVDDFAQSFNHADVVLFADIFASARENSEEFTSENLAAATKKFHQDVVYVGDLNETLDYLKDKLKPGMVLVTMGAGDVYRVRDKLLQ